MDDKNFMLKENKDIYPPFKKGLYLEEFFLKKYKETKIITKRKYIPCLWTNFQIEPDFVYNENNYKKKLQDILNSWLKENPSNDGYFTVVQHADGCLLELPSNTLIYSSGGKGDIIIPLIYEDISNRLENEEKKYYHQKDIFCSFVGSLTGNKDNNSFVRKIIFEKFKNNSEFKFNITNWDPIITKENKDNFITKIINSKFSFAPRGYGRTSFRFYEVLNLGSVPIYVWDDILWLPYQDILDYRKFSIIINIKDIDNLENILNNINEKSYNNMLKEYCNIKHFFNLQYMFEYIIKNLNY